MSVSRVKVVPGRYLDSIALLEISATLSGVAGVEVATAVMATTANLDRARAVGIGIDVEAGPSDLFIGVAGTESGCAEALAVVDGLLARQVVQASGSGPTEETRRSLAQHLRSGASADLALISVPGAFAASEAEKALRLGLHVMLFSDNVGIADEVRLKRLGAELGRLVMGPDCGTAIVNGVPLGFANAVRRGRVGVVGASGTGMQEVTTRLHRMGGGVSQAIGCGGRDLSADVGGATMCAALRMLADDPETDAIVLVSKPPSPDVLGDVLTGAARTGKPVVACFLGLGPADVVAPEGVVLVGSLAGAADAALGLRDAPDAVSTPGRPEVTQALVAGGLVRGGFVGGTFCHEAGIVLTAAEVDHDLVDFGDDTYTDGRPHPMIDPTLRNRFIAHALDDPTTAVVLVDIVLGHGAHPRPVDELVEIIRTHTGGRRVVAHVCGTDDDSPSRSATVAALEAAGVLVADSNVAAARLAAALVGTSSHG